MAWFNRGKHLSFDPNASGVGEAPFSLLLDRILVALMNAEFTANIDTQEQFDDISPTETVTDGYTARGSGIEMTGKVITREDSTDRIYFDADNHAFGALGAVTPGGINAIVIMREQDSGATNANTELIATIATTLTVTNGGPVTIIWNSSGVLQGT